MKTRFFMALIASCTLTYGLVVSCQKETQPVAQIEKKGPVEPDDPQLKPDCDTRTGNEYIESENLEVTLLPSDDAYVFRDYFMEHYTLGQQYIDYYYTISENSNNFDMWINHFNDCYDFAVATFEVADVLYNGQDGDIVITQSYFDLANSIIDLYRSYTPSGDSFHNILNAIDDDLDVFLDMTRAEVILTIED
mgnify:CR=1 FL=1